jgi:hypothetical protein
MAPSTKTDNSANGGVTLRRSTRFTQNTTESIRPTENNALAGQSSIQKETDSNNTNGKNRNNPKRSRKKITEETTRTKVSRTNEQIEDEKKDEEVNASEDSVVTEDVKDDSICTNGRKGRKRKTPTEQEPRKPDPEDVAALPKKKKTTKSISVSEAKKTNGPMIKSTTKAKKQKAQMEEEEEEEDVSVVSFENQAGKPDGNGGLDNGSTYIIEYSKTSRATCKRCDIRINKNELRVGHRPLFRGKPGYQVFKHLHCIVFSEEITCAEDVAGSDGLTDEDYKALAKRIDESFTLIQKENQELEPDELVQKKFEGEMRAAPKGLAANLLPFQEEGVSWMYHQERNVEDVRGGILGECLWFLYT